MAFYEEACINCGRPIRHVRDLVGPVIRNGRFEVWTHIDSGWAPCNMLPDGTEAEPNGPYAKPAQTAKGAHTEV